MTSIFYSILFYSSYILAEFINHNFFFTFDHPLHVAMSHLIGFVVILML